MKKTLFASAFLCLFLLVSCATYKDVPVSTVLDKTIGKSQHDIEVAIGPPNTITDDGDGGKILNYEKSFVFTSTELNTVRYDRELTQSTAQNVTHYMQFYVNKEGKVYHYRTNYPPIRVKVKDAPSPFSPPAPPPSPAQLFGHKKDTTKRS